MDNYIHTCPYCGTQLSVNELTVERTASRCPHCQKNYYPIRIRGCHKKAYYLPLS